MKTIFSFLILLFIFSGYLGADTPISPEFDLDDMVFGQTNGIQSDSTIAFDGTNYMVVWKDVKSDYSGELVYYLHGAILNSEGDIINACGFRIASSSYVSNPAIAFDGENFLVVWYSSSLSDGSSIKGKRVSKNGVVLDKEEFDVDGGKCTPSGDDRSPDIIFDGEHYFVVWSSREKTCGRKITKEGKRSQSYTINLEKNLLESALYYFKNPAVSFNDDYYMVVWFDYNYHQSVVVATRLLRKYPLGENPVVDKEGIIIDSWGKGLYSSHPDIVYGGDHFFVVWAGYHNSEVDIYGTKISDKGKILDPDGINISKASGYQTNPKVVSDGSNYFVVWEDNRSESWSDIYGARVTRDGFVMDTGGININNKPIDKKNPNVASDSKNFMVTWDDNDDVFGIKLSDSGGISGGNTAGDTIKYKSETLISLSISNQSMPEVLFDGTNYFAVWIDGRDSRNSVYGVRISPEGELLDTEAIFIGSDAYNGKKPGIAFDGENYLVVWLGNVDIDGYAETYLTVLLGARVSRQGELLDRIPLAIDPYVYMNPNIPGPDVAFNGKNFMVLYNYNHRYYVEGEWHDPGHWTTDAKLKGKIINKNGSVQGNTFIMEDVIAGGISCGKSNCLVVFRQNSIKGALFSFDFSRISTEDIPIYEKWYLGSHAVLFNGENYVTIYHYEDYYYNDIMFSEITEQGEIIRSDISVNKGDYAFDSWDITYDGENYFSVWSAEKETSTFKNNIYGNITAENGDVLYSRDLIFSSERTEELAPSVASSGKGRSLVVYQRYYNRTGYDIYRIGARLFDINANYPDEQIEVPNDYTISFVDTDLIADSQDDDYLDDSQLDDSDIIEEEDLDSIISENKGSGCSVLSIF